MIIIGNYLFTYASFKLTNLDLVVLIKVGQVMLEALCLFLPRIKKYQASYCRLPILHNHCRCILMAPRFHNASTVSCQSLKICQKLSSKQVACNLKASGRLFFQFLDKNWAQGIEMGQEGAKALARDSRRETANAKASLCRGLRCNTASMTMRSWTQKNNLSEWRISWSGLVPKRLEYFVWKLRCKKIAAQQKR